MVAILVNDRRPSGVETIVPTGYASEIASNHSLRIDTWRIRLKVGIHQAVCDYPGFAACATTARTSIRSATRNRNCRNPSRTGVPHIRGRGQGLFAAATTHQRRRERR
jgi:hypothetical protein